MNIEQRLYVRNKAAWLQDCKRNYKKDGELGVREVKNGIILPARYVKGSAGFSAGGVCDGNFNFIAGLIKEYSHPPGWGGIAEAYKVNEDELTYSDEKVVFGGVLIAYFGHMLLDNMSRLWWHVENRDNNYRYVFITTMDDEKPWFHDFFDLLGIPEDKIIILKRPTRFREILVPDEAVHSWDHYNEKWSKVFEVLSCNALKLCENEVLPPKIYITKSQYESGGSKTFNEEYFEQFYKRLGYEVIAPEKFPVWKQIALAANAKAIASTLGSTCHFNLFSKKGTRIDILLRVDQQTLLPQCLINQMVEADYRFVDVSMNYLPCHRARGVCFLGATQCWREYIKAEFDLDITDADTIAPEKYIDYLYAWADFLYQNPNHFNKMGLDNVDCFDMLERMCRILFDKQLDKQKYDVTPKHRLRSELASQRKENDKLGQRLLSSSKDIEMLKTELESHLEKENNLTAELNDVHDRLNISESLRLELERSFSYKLGRFFTFIPRQIGKLFGGSKENSK